MARRPDEFELIARWLSRFELQGPGIVVPNGDDAAAVRPTPGTVLVTTVDSLVEGVHFDRRTCPPAAVGHKALAVNLSDVAAMGARPRWVLLALGLPADVPVRWLDRAAEGMAALCRAADVRLVGGNVAGGPALTFTITVLGEARPERLLRRDTARPGDAVFVSGTLGDAALGLRRLAGRARPPARLGFLEARHCRPEPRLALGLELARRGAARACIDLSDGLAADLGHVLEAGGVGAEVRLSDLPLSAAYRRAAPADDPWAAALTGGEDYELCFTAPPARRRAVLAAAARAGTPVREIGRVTDGGGLVLLRPDGTAYRPARAGWRHF